MNRAELLEIIRNNESSGVEFKRDDVHPQSLAKEIASLANLEGGYILLGIEDDGTVTGLTRSNIEEWVMNICSDNIYPPIIPYFEVVLGEGDKKIGVITIPEDSPDKPYKARQGSRWVTFVRIGNTSREATREQEQRLYQASGVLRYDIKPAPGSSLKDLDMNRLINYFRDIRGQDCPEQPKKQETKYLFSISIDFKNDLEAYNISDDLRKAFEDNNYPLSDNVKTSIVSSAEWKISDGRKKYTIEESDHQLNIYETKKLEQEETEQWETLLINTEIMVESRDKAIPTVGGILLFGKNPNRYLPQAGISVVAYPGMEKDYEAVERETIRGPIVAKFIEGEDIVDRGLVERAIDFVRRNTGSSAYLVEGRRIDKPDYPEEVIRETIVNAIAHRDYTITGTDIELSIYSDRLEVISPGRLPNTVTVERMKAGCRVTRNELIKEVLRDYHYVEATGLGVPRKIIAGMLKHNGTEPDLIEEEYSFMVRLLREKPEE